ncbi:Pilin [uncultured Clostridium sp.]|uniref:prepilin-type N-terminal cleavage/methylation domain-containing protein n=1 Tax=uncultured Clostridium sp. TaxID=59620 RepID=UPI0008217585|nr:prepilin-type N-terminal cleavage/methylation domain-containing protein [uncultured Clostridium sp.]SCK00873.1 Pilin [uncultured Clostridium sp.]
MIKNLKNKKKGFTLIELIIVIAIIGILAAIALPKFGEVRKNANEKADLANAKTIAGAVTTLLAEEKLKLPTADVTFVLDGDDKDIGTITAPGAASGKIEQTIIDYLQSNPTSKVTSGANFSIKVTTNGEISVLRGAQPIYPIN